MGIIAGCISRVCEELKGAPAETRVLSSKFAEEIGKEVIALCRKYPLY
jgi:hypothetical protein